MVSGPKVAVHRALVPQLAFLASLLDLQRDSSDLGCKSLMQEYHAQCLVPHLQQIVCGYKRMSPPY